MVAKKSLAQIKRDDIESFLYFCQAPPKTWIGTKHVSRFIDRVSKKIVAKKVSDKTAEQVAKATIAGLRYFNKKVFTILLEAMVVNLPITKK